ncbi:MAG: hypothetical protein JWL77_82 [Chthonomonadaceae bacterium]|nr:hypothetical protein [Chthonomonadaceae bacterium]
MTQSLAEILEHRRIRTVAQDYRDRGYDVIVQPGETDLPTFLSGFQVDLYAQNSEDHVIVEVKTRTSLAKSKDLSRLAEVIQDRSGWRLELVVTNPKKDGGREEETVQVLHEDEVEDRFQQAEKLLEQNQYVLAMLLAWTATEAALRLIAQHNEVRLKEQSPAYIIKQLFSVGILDRQQYDMMDEAVQLRNTIVHGFRMNQFHPQLVQNLIMTSRNLLRSRTFQSV